MVQIKELNAIDLETTVELSEKCLRFAPDPVFRRWVSCPKPVSGMTASAKVVIRRGGMSLQIFHAREEI